MTPEHSSTGPGSYQTFTCPTTPEAETPTTKMMGKDGKAGSQIQAREVPEEYSPLLPPRDGISQREEAELSKAERLEFLGVISLLLVGEFISTMDNTLVFAAASPMATELGNLSKASWLSSAYTLGLCSMQPLSGTLSDLLGRKWMLLAGYLVLTCGCVVCGSSQDFNQMIAGRAISGIGGAAVRTLASIIITDLVPTRDVAAFRAYTNVASSLGRSLGGPAGGFIYDHFGWRWLFYGRVPLMITSLVLAWAFMRLPPENEPRSSGPDLGMNGETRPTSFWKRLQAIDYVGSLLLTTFVSCFVTFLDGLGSRPMTSPVSLVTLSVTFSSMALFVYWEKSSSRANPIFDLRILTQPNVVASYTISCLSIFSQVSMMFSVPLYLQVAQRASPGFSGMHLVPAVVANTVGALLSGIVVRRTGSFKPMLVVAGLVSGVTYVLLLLRWNGSETMSEWETLYIVPGGFATGIAFSASFVSMAAYLDRPRVAMATGFFFFFSSIGTVSGVTVTNLVIHSQFRGKLERNLAVDNAKEIIDKVTKDFQAINYLHGEVRNIVVRGFVSCLSNTYLISLSACIMSSILAISLRDGPPPT